MCKAHMNYSVDIVWFKFTTMNENNFIWICLQVVDCGNKSYRFGSPLIIIRQLMFMSKGIWCKPSRASDQQWHTFSLLTVQSMGPMFFLARIWVQSHFVSSWLHICKIWDLFVSVPVIALSISYLLANTFLLSSIIMITTHPINTLANPTLFSKRWGLQRYSLFLL